MMDIIGWATLGYLGSNLAIVAGVLGAAVIGALLAPRFRKRDRGGRRN